MQTQQAVADVTAADSANTSFGMSSNHYAQARGTLSLIIEAPIWGSDAAADESTSDQSFVDVTRDVARKLAEIGPQVDQALGEAASDIFQTNTPHARSLKEMRSSIGALAAAHLQAIDGESDRLATVAELHAVREQVHMLRLRLVGTALRCLDAELALGNHSPVVRAAHKGLMWQLEEWAVEAQTQGGDTLLPLRSLVALQLGAILVAAQPENRADQPASQDPEAGPPSSPLQLS